MKDIGSKSQQITLDKKTYLALKEEVELLKAENGALENSLVFFKKENQRVMIKIEDVVNTEKTVKYLSKKVLQYSRYRVQVERSKNGNFGLEEKLKNLEQQVVSLKKYLEASKVSFAEKCEELRATKESKAKFQSKSLEYVGNLKRKILQLQTEYSQLQAKYKKSREEIVQFSKTNEEINEKYNKNLNEMLELSAKINQ